MSSGTSPGAEQRSAEERAEELMQRVTSQATRVFGRVVGRAREEVEDLVAEARTLNERSRPGQSGSSGRRRSAR
ncbi:MAG TPA: hypothetical protein VG365_09625 [Solirubrobacteraceae bacterium]|jgi:hypothetical protein|nr:hypothetical protein [Solirubrobacteraceae bacterium]